MRTLAAIGTLALGACSNSPSGRGRATATPAPVDAGTPGALAHAPAAADARPCSAGDDARARHHDAEPAEPMAGRLLDLDGDGAADPVYRARCNGDCTYLLYVTDQPCPRFVGAIEGTVVSHPWCVEPPAPGGLCRLSITQFMIHGDTQQYFYAYSPDTGYVVDGHGHYTPPTKKDRR